MGLRGVRGTGNLDALKVRVFASGGVEALDCDLKVAKQFDFDAVFGVEGFVKEFGFFHVLFTC
jgi:hypothetical protein